MESSHTMMPTDTIDSPMMDMSTFSDDSSPSTPLSPSSLPDDGDGIATPNTSTPPSEEENPAEAFVRIPDMFISIMSAEARVNVHYEKLKKERDAWIADMMGQDSTWAARNAKVDLAYLASIWSPDASEEDMRIIIDWNHWVFLFDDQFDEGHLRSDPIAAAEECDKNMAILEQTDHDLFTNSDKLIRREDNPIQWLFQDIWHRLRKRSCEEMQRHWKFTHRRYFNGLVEQARLEKEGTTRDITVDEYMDLRTLTIGVYPAIALTEFGFGIRVPDEVFHHPSVQKCMRLSAEMVVLVNDITSYRKDLNLGVDLNIFRCLMNKPVGGGFCGFYTGQQVMDAVGEMSHECYRSWYLALGGLPYWNEGMDRAALKYVEACRNVALGNLYWSFRTGRYFGQCHGREVKDTRILRLTQSENLDIETLYALKDISRT